MQTLSEQDILGRLSRRETFEGCLNGSLHIKIQDYVPFLATAIHTGHNLRPELRKKCALSEEERRYEEDPFTDVMIASFPITLAVLDSRYEYDLNREPESAVYGKVWGKQVWNKPPTERQCEKSLEKHAQYYRILEAVLDTLNKIHSGSLLFDIHSYNYLRNPSEKSPVFNIGTWCMNLKRWGSTITAFEKQLTKVRLPNIETTVARNAAFEGRGYQAAFCRQHKRNTLVIPLDIAKVYMDEEMGDGFPVVLTDLSDQLYHSCLNTVTTLAKTLNTKVRKRDLVSSELEPVVLQVDRQLFKMAKHLNTLTYVNPVNLQLEKRRFLANSKKYEPRFRYRQLRIDPYDYRERLYHLPISRIQDPVIRNLYRDVVDSYANKVEMLAHMGTEQFLYNSLRYYGQPDTDDIANARFLLHAPEIELDENLLEKMPMQQALPIFEQAIAERGLDVKTVITKKIVAQAMVDGARKMLLLNQSATLSKLDIQALIHHEIDVHLYTTFNAQLQPLKVLSLGLPGNTHTQEGLAIFNEYMSGNINVKRLQMLSLRVLAVDMLIKGYRFSQIFQCLEDEYGLDRDAAFSLVLRVTRGGGFTKDYVYLKGLKDVMACYKEHDLTPLFMGKTSLAYRGALADLMERKILVAPQYLPNLSAPAKPHAAMDYLLTAIR